MKVKELRGSSKSEVSHRQCLSICLFCSCSSIYKDVVVQENVLLHLYDMILAKNRNSLQQHIRFSQKLTLSKYYHKIEVSYQQNGHEEIFSEVPKKEILLLMLKRNKIFIKE